MKLQMGEKSPEFELRFDTTRAGRAVGSQREQTSRRSPSLTREVRNCVPCGTTSMNMKISTAMSLASPRTTICARGLAEKPAASVRTSGRLHARGVPRLPVAPIPAIFLILGRSSGAPERSNDAPVKKLSSRARAPRSPSKQPPGGVRTATKIVLRVYPRPEG